MKIRTSFVANSSSSSFVVFGKEYSQEAYRGLKDWKDFIFVGEEYGEGRDIRPVDDYLHKLLMGRNMLGYRAELIKVVASFNHDDNPVIDTETLPKGKFNVFSFSKSYHNREDDFEETYFE